MPSLPLLYARKQVFQWLKQGTKTIDIRRGKPMNGEFAFFQCGPEILKMRIVRVESGRLADVVRADNFLRIIPSAASLEVALGYLQDLYPDCSGIFTAYHVALER